MPKIGKIRLSLVAVRKLVFFTVFTILVFAGGYVFALKRVKDANDPNFPPVNLTREIPEEVDTLDFALFWSVWDTLEESYYDKSKLIPAKMVYGAIEGMVAAVGDPYTVFLPPTENKVVQEDLKGDFDGIGIQIGFRGQQLAVVAPLPGSPAEKSGVQAGDYIIGITDTAKDIDRGTGGITLPEAVQIIRGPSGSIVTLTLLRGDSEEPIVVDITRDTIEVPSVTYEYVGDKSIAHVKILKFSGDMFEEWDEAVADILVKPEVDKIILDVRNNPGGYLQGAVDISGDFLETGAVAVIEERGNGSKQKFEVEKIGRLKNKEVLVLVNQGSASASEILAGALRDNINAMVVGSTTFGKGTIQEPQQINGGSGLHITIAKWLTPKGIWVNEVGIKPDFEVEDNPETEEDEQLQKAIEVIIN